MSATDEQKKEIIEWHYKSPCCRRSLLYGVIFAKGVAISDNVSVSLSKMEYAEFVCHLAREFLSKEVTVARPPKGGRSVTVHFKTSSAAKYISEIGNNKNPILRKCSFCQSSFLRGVFLASGRTSNPEKRFTLDFRLGERSDAFASILSTLTLTPSLSGTMEKRVVYFRDADAISDFYGYLGLNKTVFDLIEIKINKNAKMNTVRYMNCFNRNLKKMSEVTDRQLSVINRLDELNLLSSLPEELELTARMRMKYPDLPLSLLAAEMTPSISKSGLSHRLKKIEEIGTRLLSTDNKK